MRWLLAVLLSTSLYAQDWEVHVPLISKHLISQSYYYDDIETFDPTCTGNWCMREAEYIEFNYGVVLFRYHEDFKVGAGIFRNSLGDLGFLYGAGYEYKNAGIEIGMATGYERQRGMDNIIPMYSVYYRFKFVKFMLNHEIANIGLSLRF